MNPRFQKPLRVGKHFLICPQNSCRPAEERIPLYLGRARAFGSGLHETTVSCLEELEGIMPLNGAKVLDVGCGTGILAIGALLLGAARALAFDIDPEAAMACRSNAKLNGVHDQVDVFCGDLEALATGSSFDLILANIYGDIILEAADTLISRLAPGSTIILSGISFEHLSDIKRVFKRAGLELVKNRVMEEYITIVFKRRV